MSDDPDIASDQTAQDDAMQVAAAAHDLDADTEFAPPDGMASDDRSDSWGISGEEGEAGEGNAEVSWDAATATSVGDDSPDDELIATIAGALDIPRGDAFVRLLVDRLGQTTTAGGALAPFLRQLRIDLSDGPNETGAFELFVDDLDDPALNSDDLAHAVPVLAALTARTIVRGLAHGDGRVSADARQRLVREAVAATRQLMRNRREGGLAALPLVARYLGSHALRGDVASGALAEALSRIAARLSSEPGLIRHLARAGTSRPDQTWRGLRGRPRQIALDSPVEITILAR